MSESEVLGEVVRLITEVVGEDVLLGMEVTAGTTFSDDLGLESIEFVALADKLRERYGAQVDLVAFLGDMDIDEIMAMTVGQLVGHIQARPAAATATGITTGTG